MGLFGLLENRGRAAGGKLLRAAGAACGHGPDRAAAIARLAREQQRLSAGEPLRLEQGVVGRLHQQAAAAAAQIIGAQGVAALVLADEGQLFAIWRPGRAADGVGHIAHPGAAAAHQPQRPLPVGERNLTAIGRPGIDRPLAMRWQGQRCSAGQVKDVSAAARIEQKAGAVWRPDDLRRAKFRGLDGRQQDAAQAAHARAIGLGQLEFSHVGAGIFDEGDVFTVGRPRRRDVALTAAGQHCAAVRLIEEQGADVRTIAKIDALAARQPGDQLHRLVADLHGRPAGAGYGPPCAGLILVGDAAAIGRDGVGRAARAYARRQGARRAPGQSQGAQFAILQVQHPAFQRQATQIMRLGGRRAAGQQQACDHHECAEPPEAAVLRKNSHSSLNSCELNSGYIHAAMPGQSVGTVYSLQGEWSTDKLRSQRRRNGVGGRGREQEGIWEKP